MQNCQRAARAVSDRLLVSDRWEKRQKMRLEAKRRMHAADD